MNPVPGNENDKKARIERIRNYLKLPAHSEDESIGDSTQGSIRSSIEIEGRGAGLELHILRALDPAQLRDDTYSVCYKLIQKGYDIVPLTTLTPESLSTSDENSSIHLIWEGNFGPEFRKSRFISGLVKGKYSSGLNGSVIILALSWKTLDQFMKRESRVPSSVMVRRGFELPLLNLGLLLLGIPLGLSLSFPFVVNTAGSSGNYIGEIISYIAVALTVSGLIITVSEARYRDLDRKMKIYILIFLFIIVYLASTVYLLSSSESAYFPFVLIFWSLLSISLSVIFLFLIRQFADGMISIISFAAFAAYISYSLYTTYEVYAGFIPRFSNLVLSGFVTPPNALFSFSLPYMVFTPWFTGNLISITLYLTSAFLFSFTFCWSAAFLKFGDEKENEDINATAKPTTQ